MNASSRSAIFKLAFALAVSFGATAALAADATRGQQLAQAHCSGCHAVGAGQRPEVADAPPFAVAARKYGSNAPAIAAAILGPHPRMNFSPAPADAEDIAAYIATLGR